MVITTIDMIITWKQRISFRGTTVPSSIFLGDHWISGLIGRWGLIHREKIKRIKASWQINALEKMYKNDISKMPLQTSNPLKLIRYYYVQVNIV